MGRFLPVLLFAVVCLFFAGAVQAQDLIWAKRAGTLLIKVLVL